MEQVYINKRMKMFAVPDVSLTIIKELGTRIFTKEYGELIDFESGCWAAVLGHSNKEVVDVISENMKDLFHAHQFFDTEHPGALVKELVEASKLMGDYKGTFLSSGSEAVSLAVLLSELISGRKRKLSLSISYLGALSELRLPRNPTYWEDLNVDERLNCVKNSICKDCGKFKNIDFSQILAFVFETGNSGGIVFSQPIS